MNVPAKTHATTAWRLVDAASRPAQCVLSERGALCQLVVWRGAAIALWEAHASLDTAARRACELWNLFVKNGWQMPEGRGDSADAPRSVSVVPFQRACPECRQQTGLVTYRRHGYLVLFCERCEHGWTDRERSAMPSAHMPHRDRRRVA